MGVRGREGVSTNETGGRERKRQDENDGNLMNQSVAETSGAAEVGGARSTTPGQSQGQRSRSQPDKPAFSYAQALKKVSPSPHSRAPEGGNSRPPSSKVSSRSQTPSESSLLAGGRDLIKGATPGSDSPSLGYRDEKGSDPAGCRGDELDVDFGSSSVVSSGSVSDGGERSASRQSLPPGPTEGAGSAQDADRSKSNENEREDEAVKPKATSFESDRTRDSPLMSPVIQRTNPPSHPTDIAPPTVTSLSQNIHSEPTRSEVEGQLRVGDSSSVSTLPTHPVAPPTVAQQPSGNTGNRVEATPPLPSSEESQHESMLPLPGAGGDNTSNNAQVIETLLEHAPPTATPTPGLVHAPPTATPAPGLAAFKEEEKLRSLSKGEALMSAGQKPSNGKEDHHNLTLPLPGKAREGVLPSPATPMSSILPHPPGTQMAFAAHQHQLHLPLRPPGESKSAMKSPGVG